VPEAVSKYLSSHYGPDDSLLLRTDRRGTQEIRIVSIAFVDSGGHEINSAISGQDIGIRLYFEGCNVTNLPKIIVSISVKTHLDVPVFLQHNRMAHFQFGPLPKRGFFEFRIPRLPLPPSTYRIAYSLINEGAYIDALNNAAELFVAEGDFFGSGEVPPASHGVCLVDGKWALHSLANHDIERIGT
jgi:lipopolysaccharide transport system ATP-binding protein